MTKEEKITFIKDTLRKIDDSYYGLGRNHCYFSSYNVPIFLDYRPIDKSFHSYKAYDIENLALEIQGKYADGSTSNLEFDDIGPEFRYGRSIYYIPDAIENWKEDHPYSGLDAFMKDKDMSDPVKLEQIYNYTVLYATAPYVEQVVKVAPQVVESATIPKRFAGVQGLKTFNLCFKPGKTMKDITKMPDWLWKLLKEHNVNLYIWNNMRIWYKDALKTDKPLTKESVDHLLSLNYKEDTLEKMRKIVKTAKTVEGKNVFTFESLVNYLERLDMYQAIPALEALDLLKDYMKMCADLGIEPLTDSNSLKREHDVTARTYNEWKDAHIHEKEKADFEKRHQQMEKYAFERGKLEVVIPTEPKDLTNEGRNNRNCVDSYISSYASGRSTIWFIRRKENPETSYITIETDKLGENVRQAFYSSNRRIDKKEDLDFIKDWTAHNAEINKKGLQA